MLMSQWLDYAIWFYTPFVSYLSGRSAEVQLLQQRATGPRVEEKVKAREAVPSWVIIAREYISNANPTIYLYISDKWVKTSYMSVEDSIIAPCIIQTFQSYLTPVYFHTKG